MACVLALSSLLTGCQTPCCTPTATTAAPAPKPATAMANVTGEWTWACCDGKYHGELTLQQDGGKISGRLFDEGDTTGGAVDGSITGNTVKLVRTWGEDFRQDYTLTLSADGQKIAGELDGTRDEATGTHFEATRK